MTLTDLPTDALVDAAVAAAQAAGQALPATAGWAVEPVDADEPGTLPDDGRAVAVELAGFGRLVLVTGPALSRAVQVGPPPAEDLLEGVQPALDAALAALGDALGGALSAGTPAEAAGTAAAPGDGEVATSARLLDGDDHAATVVLVAPAPAPATPAEAVSSGPAVHEFAALGGAGGGGAAAGGPLELLHEVEMGVTAELGRTRMLVRDILDLAPGSVIELDRAAGAPVDVLVNGTLIARGEVVVIDEEFGIRVTEVVGYDDHSGRNRR